MPLQSLLLRGDPKLVAAAQVDSAHIVPGSRGPHVTKIQQALNQVDDASLVPDGIYGPLTAAAVADFKRSSRPPILNRAGQIDNIVGIKTLAALDAALPKGGGPSLNFDITVTFVDIVVNFKGDPAAHPLPAEEALPKGMLNSYDAVASNSKFLRNRDNQSLLLRIAHSTTEIGPKRKPVFDTVVKNINDALSEADPGSGNPLLVHRIYVLGSSSGGRNAIDFVGELSKSKLATHFVAPIDASFTQSDTDDKPNSPGRVLNVPLFKLDRIAGSFAGVVRAVKNKHNFFQARGNHRSDSFNPFAEVIFTSDMAGGLGEIHGSVESFNNHPLSIDPGDLAPKNDDQLHEEADALGRREAQLLIAKDLQSK